MKPLKIRYVKGTTRNDFHAGFILEVITKGCPQITVQDLTTMLEEACHRILFLERQRNALSSLLQEINEIHDNMYIK